MSYVVASHVLDEAAGVYRLVIVDQTTVDVTSPDPETGAPVTTQQTVTVAQRDIVFAADDDRWHDAGERRPDADVAAEQQQIVAARLQDEAAEQTVAEADATTAAAAAVEPRELPGVGEPLTPAP